MAADNVVIIQVVHLAIIKTQVVSWKLHHHSSIFLGFLTINNILLINIVNLQMLKCIIYRFEHINNNVLTKSCYILRKGL